MIRLVHRFLLDVFARLPRSVRRGVVRTIAPSYSVGAICVIERDDGHVMLIRQSYRQRWGLPGGLLARDEEPEAAALREVREEVAIEVELTSPASVFVEPRLRRVDVIYRARPAAGDNAHPRPSSPEITAVEWFPLDGLPPLQAETATALEMVGLVRPTEG